MFGLKGDWSLDLPPRYFTLESYTSNAPRWCPNCGDHAVLASVQRICRDAQVPPEKIVNVSGIGCSSRFPHYMKTYGFHSLHGRALPVACGIKARRPDLHVWIATGDGDCCSIGTAHWIHAIRYNMDMVVMLFNNAVYGLTKNQTAPTSPVGLSTYTHPRGAWLAPINPLQTTLGVTNVSFVAQTIDWNPLHLYATLKRAYQHRGFSFVQILQRCPQYTWTLYEELQKNPDRLLLLDHEQGVELDDTLRRMYKNREAHDPRDLHAARAMAERSDLVPIGVLFADDTRPRYEDYTEAGMEMSVEDKIKALEKQLDLFAVRA